MICRAPAIRAPWIDRKADAAAPNTATVDPGVTFAVLSAAPTPVMTPHPMSAARSSGKLIVDLHQRVLVHQHLLGVSTERSAN